INKGESEEEIKHDKYNFLSKRPSSRYIEYVIFFIDDGIEVSIRFLSKAKLSKEDVQDALKFYNDSQTNIRLNMSEKFMFESRPQTMDEIEKYPCREYFPEASHRYQLMKIKKFYVLGVEAVNAKLEKINMDKDEVIRILKERIRENEETIYSEFRKADLEKQRLLIALKKAESARDAAESARDATLLALSKKADELIQLRKEILPKGNIKTGLYTFCEGDKSSSSP
ncbi:hypothetical protein EBU24_06930, partial [bacterium]|nr:hypothetical protein [bacterium]